RRAPRGGGRGAVIPFAALFAGGPGAAGAPDRAGVGGGPRGCSAAYPGGPWPGARRAPRPPRGAGRGAASPPAPARAGIRGGQVGLGEVAVVVRVLLDALRERALLGLGPAPRLLHHRPARLQHVDLAVDLVLDRAVEGPERVDVLELRLDAEGVGAGAPNRH